MNAYVLLYYCLSYAYVFVCLYIGGAGPNEVGVAGMKRYDSQVAFH